MPEGPSIVILKELIAELHLHKPEIIEVAGNVKTIDKDRLLHQKIQEFRSWGKHFLICFNDFTIRIHFMLFGTYLINDTKKTALKLGLTFKKDELNFYTCKVDLLEGKADVLYDWTTDIMADEWDSKKAIKKLKEDPESYVCDILLDQHIFAGVGNIIKNEILYRSRIHPLSKIKDLPPAKIKELIKEARHYSFDFLKWKKENTLSKHWEVYSQKLCPNGHPIEKKELGKTHRQSYYCSICQKKYD
ncbi:DNA-formamidopyrimidine glycosylase family protein [Pedobacter fastidiosus]|uniref:Endonuclease n=1 Tax=Pedobacter fastidiosus TaxID=2765361 RepID=A0ABR7KMU0_9SPHI|nr:DNA-formamidopyrimidine glycosylase family protein [Pedobacter fastidiosus]MBC6109398.1 endonuclease [Pedobacter fastidiosus]